MAGKLSPKDYDRFEGRVGIANVKLPKGADKTQREIVKKNAKKANKKSK